MQSSFAAFASLAALAAFGVSPTVRSAVHAQQSSADRVIAERVLRLGGAVILDGQRTADLRSARAAGHRLSHSHARSRRRVDGRVGAEGRDPPLAIAAAPQGALSERAAVVWAADHARGRHDRALQRVAESREVRPQQAGADLHPDGRHRRQADDACPGSRKCGCTRRACRETRSRRSPS